jgi:hypothetical protein
MCGDRAARAGPHRCVCCLAADEIERLRAEVADLQAIAHARLEALKRIQTFPHSHPVLSGHCVTCIAREALEGVADETKASQEIDFGARLVALLDGLKVPNAAFWLQQPVEALKALGAAIASTAEKAAAPTWYCQCGAANNGERCTNCKRTIEQG